MKIGKFNFKLWTKAQSRPRVGIPAISINKSHNLYFNTSLVSTYGVTDYNFVEAYSDLVNLTLAFKFMKHDAPNAYRLSDMVSRTKNIVRGSKTMTLPVGLISGFKNRENICGHAFKASLVEKDAFGNIIIMVSMVAGNILHRGASQMKVTHAQHPMMSAFPIGARVVTIKGGKEFSSSSKGQVLRLVKYNGERKNGLSVTCERPDGKLARYFLKNLTLA